MMDCLNDLIHERGKLGEAWFSADRAHRYLLLRRMNYAPAEGVDDKTQIIAFIMLNPSTADADQNDPTIAKCIKFAAKFAPRCSGVFPSTVPVPHRVAIVNLYAIRATDPDDAFAHPRPVGGVKNDDVIKGLAALPDVTMIAAWGADKRSTRRAREVYSMLRDLKASRIEDARKLYRLGCASKDGSPKHPLYLRDSTDLEVHSW